MTCVIDARGVLLEASDRLLSTLGYGRDDRASLTFDRLVDQLQPAATLADLGGTRDGASPPGRRRLRLVTRSGGRLWADVEFRRAIRDNEPVHQVLIVLRDRRRSGTLASATRLIEAMTRTQTQPLDTDDVRAVFGSLLGEFLDLTDSTFGFIGEVLEDDHGAPFMRAQVLTNTTVGSASHATLERASPGDMEFRNLDSLIGSCLLTRAPVIANAPAADPRSSGLPAGDQPLDAFLGLPIAHGGALVGMVGLANRPGGYDEGIADYLYPLAALAANVIDAYRGRAHRRSAELALEQERERLAKSERLLGGIIEAAGDAIITSDFDGRMTSFNPAAEAMFGYDATSIIGLSVDILVPVEDRARHAQYVQNWSHGTRRRATGRWRRETAVRSDGTTFPAEVFNTEVRRLDDRVLVALIRDLTEHVRIQAMKDDFVSMVSHELRTPLTSIQGALGLITGGAAGDVPPQARQLVEVAHANSSRLVRLTSDLLDLQKVEAGRMTYRLVETDLVELARGTIATITPLAMGRAVRLDLVEPGAPVAATVDPDRIAQVLVNLLGNAVAVSSPGSPVTVIVVNDVDVVGMDVVDRGPGIAPADRARIWEKFVRGVSSASTGSRGAGIGLPIARALVEGHGGTLDFTTVESEGTIFSFRVPRQGRQA